MQSIKLSSVVLFPDNSNCNWHLMNTFDPIIQIMGTFPKQYTHGVLQSLFFKFVAVNKIVNHGKVDISSVGSRLTEAMNIIAEKGCHEIRVGDRVKVSGLDIQMQDNPTSTTSSSHSSPSEPSDSLEQSTLLKKTNCESWNPDEIDNDLKVYSILGKHKDKLEGYGRITH